MINYKPALIEMIKDSTEVPVLVQYPDTKIVPVIILIEDSNEQIRSLDKGTDIEAADIEISLEIYSDNKENLIYITNEVNKLLTGLGFIRNSTDEGDNGVLYANTLKYKANMYQYGDTIVIN